MSNSETGTSSDVRAAIRTRWLALGGMLVLGLIAAGCYHYWVQWRENRFEPYYRLHAYYKVHNGFINDFKRGRLEAAYLATSPRFQSRVSQDEFENRVRAYMEFHAKPDARVVGGTPISPVDPVYRRNEVVVDAYTLQDAEGNRLNVSTSVVIEDSILHRHPPTPLVDDFSVKFIPSAAGRPSGELMK